jgi:hypothetical protein
VPEKPLKNKPVGAYRPTLPRREKCNKEIGRYRR